MILILVCNFVFVVHSNMVCHIQDNEDKYIATELQIRGGIKDNFYYFSAKLYVEAHH